jgi:hypothetical protein
MELLRNRLARTFCKECFGKGLLNTACKVHLRKAGLSLLQTD